MNQLSATGSQRDWNPHRRENGAPTPQPANAPVDASEYCLDAGPPAAKKKGREKMSSPGLGDCM